MLLPLRCPLDGAYIVSYFENSSIECPACNEAFEGNKESVARYVDKNYSFELSERISRMKISLNRLENLNTHLDTISGIKSKVHQLENILKLLNDPSNQIRQANINNDAHNS